MENLELADDAFNLEALHRGLAYVFVNTGRLPQAEEACRQALKYAEQMAGNNPSANWVQAAVANRLSGTSAKPKGAAEYWRSLTSAGRASRPASKPCGRSMVSSCTRSKALAEALRPRSAGYDLIALREQAEQLLSAVRRHRAREVDLIYECFWLDIRVGD